MSKVTCYERTGGQDWVEEWYRTESRHAGRRASQLKKLGFRVQIIDAGSLITKFGFLNMTRVSVRGHGAHEVPTPQLVDRS